jgi:hypothetical protein
MIISCPKMEAGVGRVWEGECDGRRIQFARYDNRNRL